MRISTPFQFACRYFLTNVISGIIASVVTFFIIINAQYGWVQVLCQIAALIITYTAVYSSAWTEGSADYNRVKFGHMEYNKYKGLIAGLYACIPYVVIWVGLIVAKLVGFDFLPIYRTVNHNLIYLVNYIMGDGVIVTQSLSWGSVALLFPLTLILPVLGYIGYIAGFKRFGLIEKFIYKPSKKTQQKQKR